MTGPHLAVPGIPGVRIEKNIRLDSMTTWRVGGPARFLAVAGNDRSLLELLDWARGNGLPVFVIGNGSNILVSDDGFPGVVLKLGGEFTSIEISGEEMRACGGASLGSAVTNALDASLSGLEFAFGIPGTVGGAVVMNAGAYSGSVARVLSEVVTFGQDGTRERYHGFRDDYRARLVPEGEIVTEATIRLREGRKKDIRDLMNEVRAMRRTTQPWGMRTAGSVFKNPPGDKAGRLIEACGLKGKAIGGARVSEIHANFIINEGDALASDIKRLVDLIRTEVSDRFGIMLEPEVRLVGFDGE